MRLKGIAQISALLLGLSLSACQWVPIERESVCMQECSDLFLKEALEKRFHFKAPPCPECKKIQIQSLQWKEQPIAYQGNQASSLLVRLSLQFEYSIPPKGSEVSLLKLSRMFPIDPTLPLEQQNNLYALKKEMAESAALSIFLRLKASEKS